MRLINVKALLEREGSMKKRKQVDGRAKVIEFCDDEVTKYAILSHRWIGQEVEHDEIVELAKMDNEKRDEIRQRDGYRKILDSCKQAKEDGYEWLWADTCCIDKRSSAELSEAINSMYRWYENAQVCYAFLHDVLDSFPVARNDERYANGWPEWFSRGWTLQEMIAPSNVQFFNKKWQAIGDKRTLGCTLEDITGVPWHILTDGLSGDRPCVAQFMSWAANRTTTRVEDRAYSLMGLLGVNMPMLYGEGKNAFHRLQLEIIRTSNDQSIFAWNYSDRISARSDASEVRTGSILADDPSAFCSCSKMELIDLDEFINSLSKYMAEGEVRSIEKDRLGTFPVTNRGIQIWLILCPYRASHSILQAWLPCRSDPSGPPVYINLTLWESNYYRSPQPPFRAGALDTLQFRQVYLRYQDTSYRNAEFEIDDSAIIENGFTHSSTYPAKFAGNTFTLTSTDPLCVKVYSNDHIDHRFAVGFGQCFGKDWIHVMSKESGNLFMWDRSPKDHAKAQYSKMLAGASEHARSLDKARSGARRYGRVCIVQTRLRQLTLRTSCIVWKTSRKSGVKFEVFGDPGFGDVSGEWRGFDVDEADDPNCDWRALMTRHFPRKAKDNYELRIDGVSMRFSKAPEGIKLGDYGHFSDRDFCCEGNIFTDLESLPFKEGIDPRQHEVPQAAMFEERRKSARMPDYFGLYNPLCLSLPSNDAVNTLLTSLSTRSTNRYFVTRVIHGPPDPRRPGLSTTYYCTFAKPFIWSQNEELILGRRSESDEGDEGSSHETMDDREFIPMVPLPTVQVFEQYYY
ncbi:hypothetical protein SCLCIDRAFT_1217575 [Scleroderma citrinum Foug A]|uniref:Uncharacterized protein n=1 Tax=Scleroderma citrinum Foug A TaxID=1036808 RepID=A0A0C3DG16_9AGAM|nr:hypothetical protein SCLCIDRAFT_1217575 [Scleroderma citrinum Foug A]